MNSPVTPDDLLTARVLIRQALALLDGPAGSPEQPAGDSITYPSSSTGQGVITYPGTKGTEPARWPQEWLGQPVQLGADEFAVLTALNQNADPVTNTFTGGSRQLEVTVHMGAARTRKALAALSVPLVNGRGVRVRPALVRSLPGPRGRTDYTLVVPDGATSPTAP